MIEAQTLQKIHTVEEYYSHGEALLNEQIDYHEHYLIWVNSNDSILKAEYIKALLQNSDDVIDSSYLEWAMTKYIVWDYNRIKSEIDDMLQ